MSLFRGSLRPPAILSDEAVERYLEAIRADLAPDPLFRRRLRGSVLNRYVALREGVLRTDRPKQMGRLGRAVLYASFTLALTVSGTMAVSQSALPGDPLYAMKRQIEALRLEVLPSHFHDALLAYALNERIEELAGLAESGRWDAVERHALAVAAELGALEHRLSLATPAHALVVLERLLDRLPEQARLAVEGVIERANGGSSDGKSTAGDPDGPAQAPPGAGESGGAGDPPGPRQDPGGGSQQGPVYDPAAPEPGAGAGNGSDSSGPRPSNEPPAEQPQPTKSAKPEPESPERPEPTPPAETPAPPSGQLQGSSSG